MAAFPLSIHASGRYLVDSDGAPFLIHGDTAWSIVVQLTDAECDAYIDDRASRGFNTILFNAIEHKFSSQSPYYKNVDGNAPFTTMGDFSSSFVSAYWARVDRIVDRCLTNGMLCIICPAYNGYSGGDEGWSSEVTADTAAHLQTYGAALAARYTQGNVLWWMGGDYEGDATLRAKQWNIVTGMRTVRTGDLISGHPSPPNDAYGFWNGYTGFNFNAAYAGVDNVYDICATAYGRSGPMPFIMNEAKYEQEQSPTTTALQLRMQSYQALLSGACGQLFGNNPIWNFEAPTALFGYTGSWETNLSSTGSQQQTYVRRLFEQVEWWNLVPKTDASLVTGSLSSGDSRICPALASDGSFALIWVPSAQTITVDTTALTGVTGNVRVRIYSTTAGTWSTVGTYSKSSSQSITVSTDAVVMVDAEDVIASTIHRVLGQEGPAIPTDGGSSISYEFPSDVTAGNVVYFGVGAADGSTHTFVAGDCVGSAPGSGVAVLGTMKLLKSSVVDTGVGYFMMSAVWAAKVTTSGSLTLTASGLTTGGYWIGGGGEYSSDIGFDAAFEGTGNSNSTTTANTSPMTTNNATSSGAAVFIAAGGIGTSTALTIGAPGNSFSAVMSEGRVTHCCGAVADRIVSAGTTTGGTWSITGATNAWNASIGVINESLPTGQSAVPDSDVSAGAWTPSSGADLYPMVATAGDSTYIQTTSNSTVRLGLESLSTPDTGTQTVSFRATGSPAKRLVVTLLEGSSTVRGIYEVDPLTTTFADYSFNPSGIINYADLDIKAEIADATIPPSLSVTFGSLGTGATGTTSCTPSYPSGISADTSDLWCQVTGRSNTANALPTMPAGWTLVAYLEAGSGTWGVDTGPRASWLFRKDTVTGSESGAVTVSLSGSTANTLYASIFRTEKPAGGYTLDVSTATGSDISAGTGVSITASSSFSFQANDLLIVGIGQLVDNSTSSSRAISASGITFGTLTLSRDVATTQGNDHRHIIYSVPVTSGSGTVAPTLSYTASASTTQATAVFLRLRAVAPSVYGKISHVELSVPAAASGEAGIDFSAVEAADTSSAAAVAALGSTLNTTEQSDSSVSIAAAVPVAETAVTEAADSLTSAATAISTATASLSEASDTLSADAATIGGASGEITESGDITVAGAQAALSASTSIIEASDTLASSLAATLQATASEAEAADTASVDASADLSASAAPIESHDTLSSEVGVSAALVDAAITDSDDTTTAASEAALQISASIGEADDTLSASTAAASQADAVVTEANDTLTSALTLESEGISAEMTEDGDSASSNASALDSIDAAIIEAADTTGGEALAALISDALALDEADDTLESMAGPVLQAAVEIVEAGDILVAALGTGEEEEQPAEPTIGSNAQIFHRRTRRMPVLHAPADALVPAEEDAEEERQKALCTEAAPNLPVEPPEQEEVVAVPRISAERRLMQQMLVLSTPSLLRRDGGR